MHTGSIAPVPATQLADRSWLSSFPLRLVAAVFVFLAAGIWQAHRLTALADEAIWLHLQTGLWILQNHAVPRSGLFSQLASSPWIDASWGFDLLTGGAYQLFGLRGIPILLLALQVALAAAFFALVYTTSRNFWASIILAALAQFSISPMHLSPSLFSIAFLAIELQLLLTLRKDGNVRRLLWLPLLFFLWSNIDRHFCYGILALLLLCVVAITEKLCRRTGLAWFDSDSTTISLVLLGAVVATSLFATLLSPYGYHLHSAIWQSSNTSTADRFFRELHSMRFRQPPDYVLMTLAMTGFFALGRRRSHDLFLIALLVASALISFRAQRDNWLVVVVALGVIADAIRGGTPDLAMSRRINVRAALVAAGVTLALFTLSAVRTPGSQTLMNRVASTFPVAASDYIRQNQLPPPLFHSYEWGDFLTWYLPEYPVYIDGRPDLYNEAFTTDFFKLTQAEIPLESYPGFAASQTILLEANSPMAAALASLPGFTVAYKDNFAVVLMRKAPRSF